MSRPDCLFCRLVAEGDHVHATEGFVAIRDIAPMAETHLLVLPKRHVDTFREIDAFPDEEAGRMLRFVAGVAAAGGRDAVKLIWSGPDALPSEAEMADPQAWLRRVSPQTMAMSA